MILGSCGCADDQSRAASGLPKVRAWLRILHIFIAIISICAEYEIRAQDSEASTETQLGLPQTSPFTLFITPVSMIVPGTAHYAIGEHATGANLMKIGGWSWIGILTSASVIALTGAADLIAYGFIPITVISAASLLAAGAADIMGSALPYSSREPMQNKTRADQSITSLYGAFANDAILGRSTYIHATQVLAVDQNIYRGQMWYGDEGRFDSYSLGFSRVMGGNQVASLAQDSEQFYIDLDVEYSRDLIARFDLIRLQSRARIEYPLVPFGRTLQNMHMSSWLGFYRGWTRYIDFEPRSYEAYNALTGGAELLNRVHNRLQIALGYEHSRSGRVGGTGQGYFGNFHASVELRIGDDFWTNATVFAGTPNLYLLGVEYRRL